MFIKHAKSKITQIFNDINEFRGFAKRSRKSSDKSLFTRVANRLKEIELPDDLENYILLRNRAISSMELWGCNQNFDAFPDNELRTKYSTFKNCRIDVDHICDDEERDIIGIVLDSVYVEPKIYRRGRFIDYNESDIEQGDQVIGGYIENLWAVHKGRAEAHTPGLVSAILNAEVTDSSMGCFPSNTPITIKNGYKNIEDIEEGDLVRTHTGQLKRVRGLFSKDYTDGLFTIKVQGNGDEFGVTYEHPFLTIRKEELDCTHPTNKFEDASTCHPLAYKNNQCIKKHCNISENKEYKIDWIKTQDLTVGDYVAYVINDDVEHDENESVDFARLLGYYLSDGCYVEYKRNKTRSLSFNFGKHEMQYAEEVIELVKRLTDGYVGYIKTDGRNDRDDIVVSINNTVFANKVLDYAGRWSKQKKLNNKVLKWKPENQLELLGTMINGDGCNYKGAVSIEIANYELSQQLIEIASRNRIIWTTQKIKHIANENSVCKTGTESICWQIRFAKTDNEKLSKVTDKAIYFQSRWSNRKFYYKNYLFAPINKIEFDENWSGKIYNFEVEDDNSYIANNIAVHNCIVAEAECSVCGKKYADSRGVCTKHIGNPYFEPEFDEYGRQVYKTDANGNKLVDKTGNWIKEGDWLIDYSGKKGQYHIHKGKRKLAFEINHGIEFFEDSVIKSEEFAIKSGSKAEAGGEGADNRAKILEHIPTDGFRETKKKSLLDMIKKVSINESLLKDEYMKLGEEPQDITERKEELQNESVEKLDEGESDKIMTNYGKFEDLVEGNDWNNFKRLVSERIGNNNLKTSQLVGLKNFYKKSLNEKVVFKIKEMRNNRMKDDEITDRLLEMGFDKSCITEGLHYDKHFGAGEVVNSMKKHILEGISLYHKAIIDIPNMDSGMMSDRMDTQKHVDDDGVGQKPIDKDSTNAENNSLGYGKTGEKNSQLNIKVDELESIKSDLLDETKEVDTEDGKIVYNDEELTKKTEQFKHMADKNKDKLNNGRGIERYDGKYNDKEQDLSQKKVNVEDYKDLKETDKEHSTSDSGAVQKDRKLPKKQTDNRIGDSTTDFKESVDGSSKTYPNPYKEDLKTKEMIWKVESLEKMKNLLTASINEEADKKLEENDERRKGFGFENAKDLQKSQEKNNNSDSEGNLSDELDKEYIDTHTDRKKTSGVTKIATIADYFNQYENSAEETASGNHINPNGIPNDDAISNNIINQAKLTKYADDWSPETNYDKKAEDDFNLGLKPNDDFKVKTEPKDGIVKEEEGGGDYMKPIAKKAVKIDYDDDEEINMWILNDEGLYNWCYDTLVDPDSIGDLSNDAYTNFIDNNRKEIVDAINSKLSITKKSAIDVDDLEDEPTEEGDGFKMDGDEIVDIPENIEEKIKQKEADLINSLTKQKWAILTATKEGLAKNTEFEGKAGLLPENLERNEQLKEDIGNMGYNPIEVKGVYQNVYYGDSYLVYDIKLRDAFVLGTRYEQESILIPEGLLYTKDITEQEAISYNLQQATLEPVKINPNTGHFEYTMGEEATKEEFYSIFKVGDNMVNLSLGLNFKKFIPYWKFPEYVKESLIEKQKNQKAEDEHIQLDETEGGGTDLLDVDLKGDTDIDSVDTTIDDTDSKNESEETPNFDDIKEDDINFDDEDNEPEEKRSKKIVGGALPTNPMDFPNYVGKQVERRDPVSGAMEGVDTIQDLKTIKNDDGTEDVGVITNNNELRTTKDNIMETTSVLQDLMSIKFDDDDLDIEKKTAGIDELSFNITLDDDERFTTTAEAESAMGGEGFFDSISDTETDKSKGETKPMHEKKRGGLGKVNQHADRSKLNRDSLGIDDNFFDD